MLARALAQETPYLILDEPTSNLDVRHQLDLLETITRLARERGLGVLLIIHDLNLAALYCQRLVFLKQGRIVHDGRTSDVFTEAILSEIYETPIRVSAHPVTGAPQAHLVPRS